MHATILKPKKLPKLVLELLGLILITVARLGQITLPQDAPSTVALGGLINDPLIPGSSLFRLQHSRNS